MKKILIVDDEKTIRDGLEQLINTTKKYEVVGKCKNGEDALNVARKTSPDIVVTDIRMPVMDGLEFISSYSSKKTTKFIILSGYGEFEYARAAHVLNVFDYILKPVDYELFLQTLEKAAASFDETTNEISRKKCQLGLLSLQPSISSLEEIDSILKDLSMEYKNITPIVISVSNPYNISSENLILRKDFIEKYITEKGFSNIICFIYEQRIIVLIYNDEKPNIKSVLKSLINATMEKFNCKPYCSIGSTAENVHEIRKSYENALQALSYTLYDSSTYIFEAKEEMVPLENLEIYYYKNKNLTATAIKDLDKEKAYEHIDALFSKAVTENYPPEIILLFLKEIYNFCYNTVYIFKNESILSMDINKIIKNAQYNVISIEDLKTILYNIVTNTINTLDTKLDTKSNNIIEDVIKYININYKNEITLDEISNTFFINKSYFCKIFKEKTNSTFNNYLTIIRINKAKSLIIEDKHKIYEIAEMVGFKDPKYFAKTFKDITGLTPSEYKQQNSIITI